VEIGLEQVSVDKRVHTIATLLDISERKRREVSQIASASARGRIQACEELGVPAVVLTLDGSVIEANHRYHEFAGYWVNSAPFLRALGQLKLEPKTRLLFIPASERQPSVVAHLVPVAETSPPVLQDGLLVVAIFSVLSTATGISTAALIHIFGLTPAEARVAVCCRMGLRVSEISTKLDLSKETIRTELAHIFAKTGVSSQTELAALLGRIRVSEDTHWG
jgi:DNA-binding CsgD family transcriptional regulator